MIFFFGLFIALWIAMRRKRKFLGKNAHTCDSSFFCIFWFSLVCTFWAEKIRSYLIKKEIDYSIKIWIFHVKQLLVMHLLVCCVCTCRFHINDFLLSVPCYQVFCLFWCSSNQTALFDLPSSPSFFDLITLYSNDLSSPVDCNHCYVP